MNTQYHKFFQSFLLHVLPGIPVVVIYVLLTQPITDAGYPPLMALLLAALLGIVPLQLGHLFYKGYKANGKLSLKGVILTSEKMPRLRFAVKLIIALVALVIITGITVLLDEKIKSVFFSWLPSWYFYNSNFTEYGRDALMTTAFVRLVIDGFILPVTEELYFRGYLFPSLQESKYKWFTAAVLFSIYHLWQPWNIIGLIPVSMILVWPVYKHKNLYLSIAIHMLANIIGSFLFMLQIMQPK